MSLPHRPYCTQHPSPPLLNTLPSIPLLLFRPLVYPLAYAILSISLTTLFRPHYFTPSSLTIPSPYVFTLSPQHYHHVFTFHLPACFHTFLFLLPVYRPHSLSSITSLPFVFQLRLLSCHVLIFPYQLHHILLTLPCPHLPLSYSSYSSISTSTSLTSAFTYSSPTTHSLSLLATAAHNALCSSQWLWSSPSSCASPRTRRSGW